MEHIKITKISDKRFVMGTHIVHFSLNISKNHEQFVRDIFKKEYLKMTTCNVPIKNGKEIRKNRRRS